MPEAQAYPLQWPDNMPRSVTKDTDQFKTSLTKALSNVQGGLMRFGNDSGKAVTNIVISSNVSLGAQKPKDSGVAVWFVWAGESVCIPVDRYQTPEANLQAIYHIIEARRVELRHGTLHLVKATMKGFKALPPPAGTKARRPWTEVLKLNHTASKTHIEEAYRLASKTAHPDAGGSDEAMHELNEAKREALT